MVGIPIRFRIRAGALAVSDLGQQHCNQSVAFHDLRPAPKLNSTINAAPTMMQLSATLNTGQ
jgi:hypothetical protein